MAKEKEEVMTDWIMIGIVAGVATAIFGAVWLIVQDVKKGVHARITRCEHVIDVFVSDCSRKKDDFITTKGFDRFEGHITTRFNGLEKGINHLTSRVDDLVLTVRNGNKLTGK